MNSVPTSSAETTCLRCHESIGADESHSGYCFGCLLLAGLPSDQLAETEQSVRFGPYELLTHPDGSFVELGRGSMGITYQALDTALYSLVALKVINSEAAGQERNRERFIGEARAAARLRHPHVASVLYYGGREDDQCFYAMELVEGETLAQRVRRQGPLPIKDALEVMAQVASALEATEKCGVIHRDLKPANLMLVDGPGINVKVIDFGIAKIVGNDEPLEQITYDGFIGTPAFASPEQLSGGQIDQRSDYYSLGSTLYYLLTGNPPFKADGIGELAKRIDCQNSLTELLKGSKLPASAQALLTSLLSVDLNNRPQNGRELAEAVARCQRAIARPKHLRLLLTLSIIGATAVSSVLFWSVASQNPIEKSIAVLPFENLSSTSDKAYFADGVQNEILTHLATVAELKVISRDSVKLYRDPVHRPAPPEIGTSITWLVEAYSGRQIRSELAFTSSRQRRGANCGLNTMMGNRPMFLLFRPKSLRSSRRNCEQSFPALKKPLLKRCQRTTSPPTNFIYTPENSCGTTMRQLRVGILYLARCVYWKRR